MTLPAAVALSLLATPLITTLFHYGEFTVNDVLMTRNALIAYSIGLLGLILIKVLAPGFYARQNIKTPVKIAAATIVITQLLNLAFIGPLQHIGLALAISLGAYFNAGLLYYKLRSHKIYQPQPGWLGFVIRVLLALSVMSAVLWFTDGWHDIMARKLYYGACYQVNVGCDTGSYKLFLLFMVIWYPLKRFF